jgi:DNA end-binding protein Ku
MGFFDATRDLERFSAPFPRVLPDLPVLGDDAHKIHSHAPGVATGCPDRDRNGPSDRDLDTQRARASRLRLVPPEATATADQGGTASRIALRPHDPSTGKEIEKSQVVKRYEYDRGQFVTLTAEELKALDVESSKVINLERFVPRGDIDPVYFDTPYYLYPDGPVAVDALRVIGVAMAEAGVVGIGRLTLSRRERMVMVEPRSTGMVLFTVRAADEVRPAQFGSPAGDLDADMVAIASAIISQRTGTFDPSTHRDRYQEALRALIEAKLKRLLLKLQQVITPPPVIDLMAALKRSLAREVPKIGTITAKQKRPRRAADRRQRSLLLPVAGGRRRKQETATEPAAVAAKPRKKA